MLVDTISKVKNVTFDATNLDAYVTSLRGLSATQAKVVLSSTSLDKVQQKQILNKLAETTATVSLTSAEATEALTRKLGSEQAAKDLLTKAGIVTKKELETGVTIALKQELIEEAFAHGLISEAEKKELLTTFGLTGGNVGLATSFKLLGKQIGYATLQMLKWLVTTPAGWATLIIGSIAGAIAAYIKWGDTVENATEKLEESKQAYQEVKSELESVNSELKTTQDRIRELEGKDTLTLTEKEELDNLKKQNNELEYQNELLEEQNRIKNKEKNKDFVHLMDKKSQGSTYITDENGNQVELTGKDKKKYWDDFNITNYLSAKARHDEGAIDTYEKQMMERWEEYEENIEGIEYIPNPTNDDERAVNEWLDFAYDYRDRMMIALGGDGAKESAFNRVVDNWQFDEVTQKLQNLGKEGKVTAEMLNDPKYDAFIQKLIDIEFISDDTEGSLRFVASAFNGTTMSTKAYLDTLDDNESISNFINNLDDEAKALGTTKDELSKLTAGHIILNNTKLSLDDKINQIKQLGIMAGWAEGKVEELVVLMNRAAGNLPDSMTQAEKDARSGSAQLALYNFFGGWKQVDTDVDVDTPPYIPSGGSGNKSPNDETQFDDSYYSTLDAWIEENEKELDKFEKDREALNRQFENALDTGNKEQAEILRDKLAENAKTQKDILHQQNEAHRITQGNLLQSLYQYAPSLSGKSWDEISEVDLVNIENELNRASETASDDNKNQAKYNLNQFKGIVDDLKTLNDTIEDNSETWWELDDDSKGDWQSLIDFQDDYSNTWIDNQKAFDKLSEEEELAAYNRMINNNKEFQKQILNDTSISEDAKLALIKEINDKIVEIEKNAYDLRKDIFDKANDFGSSYIDSSKTLLQSYFDVTNSIAEAQHEINKELEASKTMYEWLDEDTRKLLFYQEDYNVLSEELYDIQYKADKLKRQYERDLENSTLSTVEAITSNYEMQYETLMKSYEIAKADLEIAKKKQKLNNVLNERNVRMFINGQWQWVANTEDVINAKSELADAEYAKRVEESGLTQQKSINNLTKQQDELSVVVEKFENGVIDLEEAIRQAEKAIGRMPSALMSMYDGIVSGASESVTSSGNSGSSKYDGVANIYKSNDYAAGIDSALAKGDLNAALTANKIRNDKIDYLGLDAEKWSDDDIKKRFNAHASGTRYTPGGLTKLGEEGFEAFISSNGHLIPINQPTIGNIGSGGVVFNADQMKNLRSLWDLSNLNFGNSSFTNNIQPKQVSHTQDNRIIINGLTVDNGSTDGQALISALRRYVGNH